jgi:hypothetical protein
LYDGAPPEEVYFGIRQTGRDGNLLDGLATRSSVLFRIARLLSISEKWDFGKSWATMADALMARTWHN